MNPMIQIMKNEIVCALGCTEPSAVALAVAKARETLGEDADKIELYVSPNVLKNALNVGIPGTDLYGIDVAAALGCMAGKSCYGLEVLRDVTEQDIFLAKKMIAEDRIRILMKDSEEKLYIQAKCYHQENSAEAVIQKLHTNISSVCRNDEVIFLNDAGPDHAAVSGVYDLTVKEIFDFVNEVDVSELSFLDEVIETNLKIANEGLLNTYGMGVGKHLLSNKRVSGKSDFQTCLTAYTAAAADARMAGCTLPVMATSGSGNQGLTASLPVITACEYLNCTEEMKYRALALSELVTIHVKEYIGKLSALCGCAIAASVGTACGLTYLFGGGFKNIEHAIKNMVADISGLICDGAKAGCALKIATSVSGAIQCALLAAEGIEVPGTDGIVCPDVEQTIQNLGSLGNKGMIQTDHVILHMMLENKEKGDLQ